MTVEAVTQAVSNLALQFGEEDADPGAMASVVGFLLLFVFFFFLCHCISCSFSLNAVFYV